MLHILSIGKHYSFLVFNMMLLKIPITVTQH